MNASKLFLPLVLVCFHILGFYVQGAEITATERDRLKEKWKLQADKTPYQWVYDKREPSFKGQYELSFPRSSSVSNLPKTVKDLTSTAWNNISQSAGIPGDVPYLDSHPAIGLHVVDITSLPVYHETGFKALPIIVDMQPGAERLEGKLNANVLRFTNPQREPAFYTSVDHMSGFMNDRPQEILLKLKTAPKKNVFVLSMVEPLSEEEKTLFLTKLTEGNKSYWKDYQAKYPTIDGTDFDRFQNAVVEVLREKYGIPVDLMLYVKDWTSMNMGRPTRQIYTWPVFFDRRLLTGTKVDKTFYLPFSREHSSEAGVNDKKYTELTPSLYTMLVKNPILNEVLTEWASSAPFDKILQDILGEENSADPKRVKAERIFWKNFMGDFQQALLSTPPKELSTQTDKLKLQNLIEKLAKKKWQDSYKNEKYQCFASLSKVKP